jgi:hypothetical protein
MKYIVTSLLTVSLVLVCSLGTLSQNNSPNKTPARKFKHNSKVEKIYDKVKNQTTVYLRPMTLRYIKSSVEARVISESKTDFLPADMLHMTAYFVSPGKVLVKPESVVIGFRSQALDQTKYAGTPALSIKLDASSLSLGPVQVTERRIDNLGSNQYVLQSFELPLPFETFRRITNAQKVTVRLASDEFELSNEHLEAFRDLLSRIE